VASEQVALQPSAPGSLTVFRYTDYDVPFWSRPNTGLLTFPWVGERLVHRGNGGQSPASDSIASAISAPAEWKP
jgi:hypothetical protein